MKKRHYMGKLRVDIRIIQEILLPSPYYNTFVTKIFPEEEGCLNLRRIQASNNRFSKTAVILRVST